MLLAESSTGWKQRRTTLSTTTRPATSGNDTDDRTRPARHTASRSTTTPSRTGLSRSAIATRRLKCGWRSTTWCRTCAKELVSAVALFDGHAIRRGMDVYDRHGIWLGSVLWIEASKSAPAEPVATYPI